MEAEEKGNTAAVQPETEAENGRDDPAAQGKDGLPSAQPGAGPDSGSVFPMAGGPVIRAKYNKKELRFTEAEAAPLVQKGLKFESMEQDIRKLRRLALAQGIGVSELLDRLLKESDETAYCRALEACGGNREAAAKLAAFQRREQEERAGGRTEDQAGQEFRELNEAFPGRFSGAEELPQAVVELAARRGISLFDAVLRFDHEQARQAQETQAAQVKAATASAGPMGGDPLSADLDADAFSAAFAAALH